MRKLNTTDVFAAARIVKASGMREQLKKIVSRVSTMENPDLQDVGMDSILMMIEALSEHDAENAIYSFLSGPFEMDPKEIASMELTQLVSQLSQIAQENDLASFFNFVSGIAGKN